MVAPELTEHGVFPSVSLAWLSGLHPTTQHVYGRIVCCRWPPLVHRTFHIISQLSNVKQRMAQVAWSCYP